MSGHFKKEMIISVIIVLGSILVFGTSLYFLAKSLKADATHISNDRLVIAHNASMLGVLAELKRDASQADLYQKAIEKILVPRDRLLDFQRWLDGLRRVRQVDMNFAFVGSESAPTETFPGYISFSLDISGTLDNLTAFLKDIELQSTQFLVSLDTFDVSGSGSSYRIISRGRVFFK